MRALLTHPLHALVAGVLAACLLPLFSQAVSALPRPIGFISDYGSVLDSHGRERLGTLIDEVRARAGIDLFILATWENPLSDVRALAEALLAAWDLERRGPTVLAVFLRSDGSWSHAVVGNQALADSRLPGELRSDIRDLVEHARIEEAMMRLASRLLDDAPPASAPGEPAAGGSLGIAWAIPLVLVVAGLLIAVIRRRLCPQCGRILHVEASRPGTTDRVYFCSSCGFRRSASRLRK
jgi:hypothetical protein